MKYISIKELKNQAKKKRKNNTSIKNHSESLDIVSNSYGYLNWQELLDNSILPIKNEINKTTNESKIIDFVNMRNAFYGALQSRRFNHLEKILTNFYIKNSNNQEGSNLWQLRSLFLLNAICSQLQYIEHIEFKDFKSLFNLDNLINSLKQNDSYNSAESSNYLMQIFVNDIHNLNHNNYVQHGYLAMQFFTLLHNLEVSENLFDKTFITSEQAILTYKENPNLLKL